METRTRSTGRSYDLVFFVEAQLGEPFLEILTEKSLLFAKLALKTPKPALKPQEPYKEQNRKDQT